MDRSFFPTIIFNSLRLPLGAWGAYMCGLETGLFIPLIFLGGGGAVMFIAHLSEPETQLRNVLRCCEMTAGWSRRCTRGRRGGETCRQRAPGGLLCLRRDPDQEQARRLHSIPAQKCSAFPARYASSEPLRAVKSPGFEPQLCCRLAGWPWAGHVASGAQGAVICRRRELGAISEAFQPPSSMCS